MPRLTGDVGSSWGEMRLRRERAVSSVPRTDNSEPPAKGRAARWSRCGTRASSSEIAQAVEDDCSLARKREDVPRLEKVVVPKRAGCPS